ncbi:MAG: hypothetical protein FRX49_05911 [Trebouxia sp. A1-2]|nr:MAG: hypothetical protein FRX49_05911 [Trebouxia sp. A1-2]
MRAKLLPAASRWRFVPALDCFLGSREGGGGGGGGRGSLAEYSSAAWLPSSSASPATSLPSGAFLFFPVFGAALGRRDFLVSRLEVLG